MKKTEFNKIKKEVDSDSKKTIEVEEKVKELGYELQKNGNVEMGEYLIDIAHYSRFIRHNPNIQANLVQYSYWKNTLNNGKKSY